MCVSPPAAAGWSSPPGGCVCTGSEPRSDGWSGQSALPGWHWGDGAGETRSSQKHVRGWSVTPLQGSKVRDTRYGELSNMSIQSDVIWLLCSFVVPLSWAFGWIIISDGSIIMTCVGLNCDSFNQCEEREQTQPHSVRPITHTTVKPLESAVTFILFGFPFILAFVKKISKVVFTKCRWSQK